MQPTSLRNYLLCKAGYAKLNKLKFEKQLAEITEYIKTKKTITLNFKKKLLQVQN